MFIPLICRQENFPLHTQWQSLCGIHIAQMNCTVPSNWVCIFYKGLLMESQVAGHFNISWCIHFYHCFSVGTQTLQLPGFCTEGSAMLIKALIAIAPYSCKTAAMTMFTFNVWKAQPASPASSWERWRGDNRHLMVEADSVHKNHHITRT